MGEHIYMKYQLIKASINDQIEILNLLQLCFDTDFTQCVPKIYQHLDEYINEHYIVKDLDKIIAVICIHPIDMHINNNSLKIATIGSVCVHPDYRHLGIMQLMINNANKIIEDNDYDLAILCGKYDRYHHFGYEKLLGAYTISFNYNKQLVIPSFNFININNLNENEIIKLNSIRNKDIYIDRKYFKDSINQWNYRGYAIYHNDNLIGYLVSDHSHINEIHVLYNYNIETIIHSFMDTYNIKEIDLLIMSYDKKILDSLKNYNVINNDDQLCRVINFQKVLSLLLNQEHKYDPFKHGIYSIYIENYGGISINIDDMIDVKNINNEKYDHELSYFDALKLFLTSGYHINLYFYNSDLI